MLTLKRLLVYLISYTLLFGILIFATEWRWADNYITNLSNKANPSQEIINKDLVFVSVNNHPDANSECESFNNFRQNIINLLEVIAEEAKYNDGPKGVILDIWFSKDVTLLDNLGEAITNLQNLGVKVYASYNINAIDQGIALDSMNFNVIEDAHAIEIYNILSKDCNPLTAGSGRYHTYFYPELKMASYEHTFIFRDDIFEEDVKIESLPLRVAKDLGNSKFISKSNGRRGSIVPYAGEKEIKEMTYTFSPDSVLSIYSFVPPKGSDSTMNIINIDKKILIVGDPEHDIIGTAGIPGPYVLTWAISDILEGNQRLNLPIENLYVIIGQMLAFALLVVIIFAILYKYLKILRTKALIKTILSFVFGLGILFIYYRLILTFNAVIPIGQTIASMLVAAFLCYRFSRKFLVTSQIEGSEKYDVFISYSRNHSQWVIDNIYSKLESFRKPNGDKLKIFFDQKEIGIGEAFTSKYMWAIVDSKLFVPIISEEYYGKNHCKNELDLAVNRSVEKLLSINMIAFTFEAVPEPYRTFNFMDINKQPNYLEKILDNFT